MRILFITATRIGDATLSTATLEGLRLRYPTARFTIACGAITESLFRDFPALDQLIPLTKRAYSGHWLDLWRQVVSTRWDLVVDLRGSLLGYMLRAKKRVRFPGKQQNGSMAGQWAHCAGVEGVALPTLWRSEKTNADAGAWLGEVAAPLLALAPAANWPPKEWPLTHFIQLTRQLDSARDAHGMTPLEYLVVAAPGEVSRLQPLLEALPSERLRLLAGDYDLLGVAAVLARCNGFVGNDSGLMHMAAAVGIPTLGLFGPSNASLYAPVGARTQFLAAPEAVLENLPVHLVAERVAAMLSA